MRIESRRMADERTRIPPATHVLLTLMVLAQLVIANEIRFQGCIAREDRLTALAADELSRLPGVLSNDCSRIPLL